MEFKNIKSKLNDIKIKINNISGATFLFFVAWMIILYWVMLTNISELHLIYEVWPVQRIAKKLVLIILSVKFLIFDKNSLKRKIIFILLVLSYQIFAPSYFDELFILFLFACCAKGISFEKFIKYDLVNKLIILLLILLMCHFGIISNFTSVINGNFKQALGFGHPNTLGIYVCVMLLEYIYIIKNKMNFWRIGLVLLSVLALYMITKARTAIGAFLVCFLVYLVILKIPYDFKKNKIICKILEFLPLILTVVSFLLVFLYLQNFEPVIKLNQILTGRLDASCDFLREYGVRLFGQRITIISTRDSIKYGINCKILDMGYIRLLISFGPIALVLFNYIWVLIQRKAIRQNNKQLLLLSMFFIITGFMESYFYNVMYNISYIALYSLMEGKKENEKNDKV